MTLRNLLKVFFILILLQLGCQHVADDTEESSDTIHQINDSESNTGPDVTSRDSGGSQLDTGSDVDACFDTEEYDPYLCKELIDSDTECPVGYSPASISSDDDCRTVDYCKYRRYTPYPEICDEETELWANGQFPCDDVTFVCNRPGGTLMLYCSCFGSWKQWLAAE